MELTFAVQQIIRFWSFDPDPFNSLALPSKIEKIQVQKTQKDPDEIFQWIGFLDAKPVHLPYHNLSGNFFNFFGIQTRWCDQYHFIETQYH